MRTKPEIVRVWGRADSFDIEFERIEGTFRWKCSVPPDTSDGIYAVEIWAVNEIGQMVYYTAELYMCGGVCHLKFKREPYEFVFIPQTVFKVLGDRYSFTVRKCEHNVRNTML